MTKIPSLIRSLAGLAVFAVLLTSLLASAEFEHEYRGNTPPEEATPILVESRKSGGGEVSTESGQLLVKVPVGGNHFYTIEGRNDFDGSINDGTTIDFSLRLEGEDPEQAVFSLRVGTGEVSWYLVFYPEQIQIGSLMVAHNTTENDVYRIAFQDNRLSLFSSRSGELAADLSAESKHGENRISFGTRNPIDVKSPVVWELGFLRWTNKEARFSPPPVESSK